MGNCNVEMTDFEMESFCDTFHFKTLLTKDSGFKNTKRSCQYFASSVTVSEFKQIKQLLSPLKSSEN